MPANRENSAVATGLEKVSFRSNPKESEVKSLSRVQLMPKNAQAIAQLHWSYMLVK